MQPVVKKSLCFAKIIAHVRGLHKGEICFPTGQAGKRKMSFPTAGSGYRKKKRKKR